jgi:hypothetical protein
VEFLIDLWLPILINGVVLFFASFAAWVLLPHHHSDKKKLPKEQELMDFLKPMDLPPGNYMFPYADTKAEYGSKEVQDRYAAGPRGCLDVHQMPNMGMNMAKTVVFFLVTSAVIGYITHFTCPPGGEGVDFWKVFRVAGTIGILTHASSGVLNNIWFQRRSITDMIDGVVFGLILGLIFGLLWPTG